MPNCTKRAFLLTAAMLLAILVAGPPSAQAQTLKAVKERGTLNCGVGQGLLGFSSQDDKAGWSGLDVDVCRAVAAAIFGDPTKVTFTPLDAAGRFAALQSNKIDIFFGLNPTPKRALVVDFSVPVFNNAFTMIAKKGLGKKTWDDFNTAGVRIAVDAGSSQDQVATRLCPKAQILRFKTTDEAAAAVMTGRAEAQCIVMMLSLTMLKKNPSLGELVVPSPVFATTSNAGFRRETDKTWRDFVNTWLEFNRGLGLIRSVIIRNMESVGITEADMPAGITL